MEASSDGGLQQKSLTQIQLFDLSHSHSYQLTGQLQFSIAVLMMTHMLRRTMMNHSSPDSWGGSSFLPFELFLLNSLSPGMGFHILITLYLSYLIHAHVMLICYRKLFKEECWSSHNAYNIYVRIKFVSLLIVENTVYSYNYEELDSYI